VEEDVLIRLAEPADLDGVAQPAGSKDRVAVRLDAAEREADSMVVAVASGVVQRTWATTSSAVMSTNGVRSILVPAP
jgi:hypothetical protein